MAVLAKRGVALVMKRPNPHYLTLLILVIIYLLLFFATPQTDSASRYNLSQTAARTLSLIVVVPYTAIWFAAFYGFIKVKNYARLIRQTKDGKALSLIGDGLMILAIYLPLTSLMSILRTRIVTQDSSLMPEVTILYNYFALGMVLLGFFLIRKGARKLVKLVKSPPSLSQKIGSALFFLFSAAFAYFTLTNPARQFPTATTETATYYLPDWLIAATIVVPYIIVWFLGYQAAYQIFLYKKNVKGLIYREALGYLSAGIAATVGSIMFIRLLTLMTGFFENVGLKILLLIVYLLLIIISIGYILVALGAKKLQKIEEV